MPEVIFWLVMANAFAFYMAIGWPEIKEWWAAWKE